MKMLACVVFEMAKDENVADVIDRIEKAVGVTNAYEVRMMTSSESCWRNELRNILQNLGEGASTKGYSVIFDVMEYVEQNPECKNRFMVKELYAYVSEKTGASYAQVERNIRAMIDRIYNNNTTYQLQKNLGYGAAAKNKMPNAKFIALLIDKLF